MSHVAWAIVRKPLDLARCPGHGTESCLDGLGHEIPHHAPVDANRRGDVTNGLAIAGVETECHVYPFSIPALNRERIGAPARIARNGDDFAVMGPGRLARVPLQQ
jgi:hypothetical protein